jgi:hypothetical protein
MVLCLKMDGMWMKKYINNKPPMKGGWMKILDDLIFKGTQPCTWVHAPHFFQKQGAQV